MKLPKLEDKFVITEKKSPCYGNVVSGVHLDVRTDEDNPDRLWYYVRVDRAYEGDVISCYGGYVYASLTLEGALDYVAQYLTPYQEQEEKADEGSVVEEKTSDGRGLDKVSGIQKEVEALDRSDRGDHDPGRYNSYCHLLTDSVDSAFGIAGRLGGVSLA